MLSATSELSLAQRIALLPEEERTAFYDVFSHDELEELQHAWKFWGRPKQQEPPGDWIGWLILAGRGWGKTQTGAHWIYKRVREGSRRLHLIAPTSGDARDTMIEGPAGILATASPSERPEYFPSKRKLEFPNGAVGILFSSEEPDRLRGPQCDTLWADEPAAWKYLQDTWDNAMMGLRLGSDPRWASTTTPRPLPLVKEWVKDDTVFVTRGSTYENIVNLAPAFAARIIARYENTRLGRQELYAEILDDNPYALWKRVWLDEHRVVSAPDLSRVVVAIDPAASANEHSDETGIIVAGRGKKDKRGYILDDITMERSSPSAWGSAAVAAYHRWQADAIVIEVNQGGDMAKHVIESVDSTVRVKKVHAARGKQTRAEPVSGLYEQGRVSHVGSFPKLEDQQCEWDPTSTDSPDRVDALVWAITDLMIGSRDAPITGPASGLDRVNPWI